MGAASVGQLGQPRSGDRRCLHRHESVVAAKNAQQRQQALEDVVEAQVQ